jgi:gamma-glutamyltranspeptidase/glutathione hydrolase
MVAAANNQEVEAGYRIVTSGGNAVDAGVASVLTAAVTEQSRFGLGGEMPLLIKMAGKPVIAISGVGTAPAKATPAFYKQRPMEAWEKPGHMPPIPGQGIRSAILPGVFDGLILALQEYGTMSFEQVSAPAMDMRRFPIAEEFAGMLRTYQPILDLWPASKSFYYPNGTPPKRGEIVRMPTLAKTLRELAAEEKKTHGNRAKKLEAVRDLFYKGSIAKRIGAFSEANQGLITYDDLKNFHDPGRSKPALFRALKSTSPASGHGAGDAGGTQYLDEVRSEGHGPQFAGVLAQVVETVKLAFADRDHYGDRSRARSRKRRCFRATTPPSAES